MSGRNPSANSNPSASAALRKLCLCSDLPGRTMLIALRDPSIDCFGVVRVSGAPTARGHPVPRTPELGHTFHHRILSETDLLSYRLLIEWRAEQSEELTTRLNYHQSNAPS